MSSESEYMDIVMASFDFDTNISRHTWYVFKCTSIKV